MAKSSSSSAPVAPAAKPPISAHEVLVCFSEGFGTKLIESGRTIAFVQAVLDGSPRVDRAKEGAIGQIARRLGGDKDTATQLVGMLHTAALTAGRTTTM